MSYDGRKARFPFVVRGVRESDDDFLGHLRKKHAIVPSTH